MCGVWWDKIKSVSDRNQGVLLRVFYHQFRTGCRKASLAEEEWHSFQKRSGKGDVRSFEAQVDSCLVESIRRSWEEKGLRDLSKPEPLVRQAFTTATKVVVHRRHKQLGNPALTYSWSLMSSSERKQAASDNTFKSEKLQEGRQRYNDLPPEEEQRTRACVAQ